MADPRDCALLRPVLVAAVYGEPHPELPRLEAHLRECSACRAELDDLRETRGWITESLQRSRSSAPRLRKLRPRWELTAPLFSRGMAAAAMLTAAAAVFLGAPGAATRPAHPGLAIVGSASSSSGRPFGPFGVDPLDVQLDAVEAQIAQLGGSPW